LATTIQVCNHKLFTGFDDVCDLDTDLLQRLLDHLNEAGFYSSKDLNSITKTLESTRETLERGRDTYSPALLTLLESRLEQCEASLEKLQKGLAVLAPPLAQTYETLVSILRSTSAVNTRSKVCSRGLLLSKSTFTDILIVYSSQPPK
jgi:hypothetical protein